MHPELIKAQLKIHGFNQASLARELGVAGTTVFTVIAGEGRSRRIEKRIAEIIEKPLREIWPQWYEKAA